MILIVNLKNKLTATQIDQYLINTKNSNLVVCVPENYKVTNFNNCLMQNFNEIEDIKFNNCLGSIINHHDFNENLIDVNKKLKLLIKNKLVAVVCLGEKTKDINVEKILKNQIDILLKNVCDLKKVVFAYEPLWAIGGDKQFDNEYILNNIKFIKNYINKEYKTSIKIIYGGSVDKEIINQLKNIEGINGFLISTFAVDYKNVINLCD